MTKPTNRARLKTLRRVMKHLRRAIHRVRRKKVMCVYCDGTGIRVGGGGRGALIYAVNRPCDMCDGGKRYD